MTRGKISKLGSSKLKTFMFQRTIKKVKIQTIEWEKISNKGLASKMYKEILQINNKKKTTPVLKWAKTSNRYFSKEDIQMAYKHVKSYLTPLVSREIEIEITVIY